MGLTSSLATSTIFSGLSPYIAYSTAWLRTTVEINCIAVTASPQLVTRNQNDSKSLGAASNLGRTSVEVEGDVGVLRVGKLHFERRHLFKFPSQVPTSSAIPEQKTSRRVGPDTTAKGVAFGDHDCVTTCRVLGSAGVNKEKTHLVVARRGEVSDPCREEADVALVEVQLDRHRLIEEHLADDHGACVSTRIS